MSDHDVLDTSILIAGGGIGGLTTALALHARGIDCRVLEVARELRSLGVGINLLPHAVRELASLGADVGLAPSSIETAALAYYNRHGQEIWSEPRGRGAGYGHPQYSLHRGRLQMHLFDLVRERLGPAAIVTGLAVAAFTQTSDDVVVHLAGGRGGPAAGNLRASLLIGADGIHSAVRQALHPDDGGPRYSGRMLWRAITRAEPFLGGRTMIMAGHRNQKFVCYPIEPKGDDVRHDINWIAELPVPGEAPPPQDWAREVATCAFRAPFEGWRFPWLDVPALIDGARTVYEYPLSDRDPLERWNDRRVTLLGDAAHPMYPIGSNGASQAILDAASVASHLATQGCTPGALAAYEAERRPPTSQIVLLNRQDGPEQVMQIAEERAPEGFSSIDDVIPRAELEQIAARYKQAAGFSVEQVNR